MDVLVVDDDPYVQRSLTFVLRREGFAVEVASNGEEAMFKARNTRPKIVFLDIMMPKMNGFSTCRSIKEDVELKEIYVIILTGKGQEIDREQGFREGADEFITKPFSPREIVSKVRALLGAFH
ncbi:MAG: response regulator [Candidatus Sulfobium sp.]|jgi:two-component system alkaline phosphatase synthesis response regulator PhoP